MEASIKNIYEQLERDLHSVSPEVNAVRGYNLKAELAEAAIGKMKEYLRDHPFPDTDIEIAYFKRCAPRFFKLQIFYTLLYNLELSRITIAEAEGFKEYLKKKIKRTQRFLKRHEDLWIYYLLAETARDKDLFIHACPSKSEDFLTADSLYCKNSILLAKIMAYEECLPVLTGELDKLEREHDRLEPGHSGSVQCKWNGSKAQAAELIYALVKVKCISAGGREADIKDLVNFFRESLGFEIDNIYDVELHNKKRKKERAPFLNAVLQAYLMPDK